MHQSSDGSQSVAHHPASSRLTLHFITDYSSIQSDGSCKKLPQNQVVALNVVDL